MRTAPEVHADYINGCRADRKSSLVKFSLFKMMVAFGLSIILVAPIAEVFWVIVLFPITFCLLTLLADLILSF